VKRLLASCVLPLVLLAAHPAPAQVSGQFGGAVPIPVDARVFGTFVGLSQHQWESQSQLRLCFYPGLDFGIQAGLHHYAETGAERNAIEIGGDVRTQVAKRGQHSPFDVSLGGALTVSSADHYNVLAVGPQVAVSRTYGLHAGAEFVPYAGTALLYSRYDVGDVNWTDVSMPFRFGLEYKPNPSVHAVLETQLPFSDPQGTHPKLFLGANFPF
jgi:hypothetical protein